MADLIALKNTNDILTAAEANAMGRNITAPAAPTIARVSGVTGAPAIVSATVRERSPDAVSFALLYDITPGATGLGQYSITPPSGWVVGMMSVGVYITATALPEPVAPEQGATFLVNFTATTARRIAAMVLLMKT